MNSSNPNPPAAAAQEKGLDGFALDPTARDYPWHKRFSEFLEQPLILESVRRMKIQRIKFADQDVVKAFAAAPVAGQVEAIESLVRRRIENERRFWAVGSRGPEESDSARVLTKLTVALIQRCRPETAAQAASLISVYLLSRNGHFVMDDAPALLKMCEKVKGDGPLPSELHAAVTKLAAFLDPANDQEGGEWEGVPERRTRLALGRML
jgi:hypothetical protein